MANRWRGKLAIPPHAHPFVRELIQRANEEQTTMTEIADRAGLKRDTVSRWRSRNVPQLALLEAALNVLDLELCIRPKRGESANV